MAESPPLSKMEIQTTLQEGNLEQEKLRFIYVMCMFLDGIDFDDNNYFGRPREKMADILKCLLVMTFHNMSYRRSRSDLMILVNNNFISRLPSRSVMNKYALQKDTRKILEILIQKTAMFFSETEDTLIIDSSWLGIGMYTSAHHIKKSIQQNKKEGVASLYKTRKIHVGCMKNSRIIAYAKATNGTTNDSPIFKDIVNAVFYNGFPLKFVLADAGYSSKENYILCHDLMIDAYIDFRSNATGNRGGSPMWRQKLNTKKFRPELWHQFYNHRVIIEQIFSALKRKQSNYIRSRTDVSMDVELLLRVLVYNFTIIGKMKN